MARKRATPGVELPNYWYTVPRPVGLFTLCRVCRHSLAIHRTYGEGCLAHACPCSGFEPSAQRFNHARSGWPRAFR